jgi:PAS domain S-box-containing protein
MGREAPLLPFILAVLLAASAGGLGPALLATALSPLVVTVLFTAWPNGTHPIEWSGHVGFFILVGGLTAFIMQKLQRASHAQASALIELRTSQEEAQHSETQLRLIADALPALVSYVDKDYRYRFNNRRYREWFGFEPSAMLGRHAAEVLGDAAFAAAKPHFDAALAGKHVIYEAEIPYASGVRHVRANYVPDVDTTGDVRGIVALIEDVSARKQVERALDDARNRLSFALRAGGAGSFDWDISSNVIAWSEESLSLHGFSSEDPPLAREAWLDSLNADDRPVVQASLERALVDGELAAEYRIRRNDGEPRWIQISGQTIYGDDGKPRRVLGVLADITKRKVAEESLREADRRKDEFLAMLSHELRNPLAPIQNVAHILMAERLDPAMIRWGVDVLRRQASHLTRLVDDLLDVARITRGAITMRKEALSIASVLDAAVEVVEPVLAAKRQTINLDVRSSPLHVEGDPVRLTQVFGNILTNAAKYSPDRTTIDVVGEATTDAVIVRVRDQGIGLDSRDLPKIFELFAQAARSLDRSQGGLGIGLTIAQQIVRLHGGEIEARSAGVGHGSEFIVRLPRLSTPPPSTTAEPAAGAAGRRLRILVVDDNVDAAESLALILQTAGHETRVAHDGPSALAALGQFPADVVLLDLGLPGLDGYAVATSIREQLPHTSRRIYALSGYGREQDVERSRRAGFDGHLVKPVDPGEVLRIVDG